jgi:hypothetical protein
VSDQGRRSIGDRVRRAYRFWSTDERFSFGARNQFVVMGPFCAIAAVVSALVGAWLPAVLFAVGAAYMGNWLIKDRRRRSD